MASGSLGSLVIELGASVVSLQSDFARAQQMTDVTINAINAKINSIGSGSNFNGLSSQVQSLTADFNTLQNVVGGVFGASLGIGGLKQLEDLADAYQGVTNRILTTVSSTQQLAQVEQQLFDVAQQTGASLDDTAKTYQRLEQVIEGTGASQIAAQTQAIALTKILNEEIVVSGSSAGEASHAIMDLVHGLAGGELQTRQLNQIMRQMPDLARQIAAGLGVSTSEMEAMAKKGIDATAVLQALQNQAGNIDARFQALPATFARAWQVLSNAVEQYVGQASQASAVSDLIKASIIGIADHIGAVATGAEAVAAAMALWLGGKGLQSIGSLASTLVDVVTAQGAYKTAAIASAEADIAGAQARAQAAAATVARLDAENDLRVSQLAEAKAASDALIAEQAQLEARQRNLATTTNVIADEERLIAVRAELATTTAKIAAVEDAMATSQARATLAEQAETAATAELAASKAALVTAQTEATAATGLFARAGEGLLAFVGGLPTVILAAAAALVYFGTRESELEQESDKLSKIIDQLNASHGRLTPQMQQTAEAAYEESKAMEDLAAKNLAAQQAQITAVTHTADMHDSFIALSAQAQHTAGDLTALTNTTNKLAAAFLAAKAASFGNWIAGIADGSAALGKANATIDEFGDKMVKVNDQMAQQVATFGKGKAAVLEYQLQQTIATATAGLNADATAKVTQELKDAAAPAIATAQALDTLAASHKGATKASNELYTSQQQLLTIEKQMADMLDTLAGGQGVTDKALADYNKTLTDASRLANEYLIHTNDLAGALNFLDQATNKATGDLIRQHDAMQQEADVTQHAIDGMQQQLQLTGLSTDARKAETIVMQAVAAAQDQVNKGNLYAHTLSQQEIDDLRQQAAAFVAHENAIENDKKVMQEWASLTANAFDSAFQAINKDIVEGGSVMKDLVNVAKTVVEQIILEFEKLAIINPILNAIFGVSAGNGSLLPTLANSNLGGLISGGGAAASWLTGSTGAGATGPGIGIGLDGNLPAYVGSGSSGGSIPTFGVGNLLNSGLDSVTGTSGGLFGFGSGIDVGSVLGLLTSAYAGLSEFKNAGGGVAGLAGGAAYGYGTYAAGAGIAAGGSALLAGEGISAAFSAGLAAIPVLGWVALGATVLNAISGGNLFGTSWKPDGQSAEDVAISATGGTVTDTEQEKKKSALFGGNKYKDVNVTPSADQVTAVNSIFSAIQTALTNGANTLGVAIPTIIGGAFTEKFNADGSMASEMSTVLGQTYNETIQQFAERVTADNLLQLLPAAQNASAIAQQWQSSADTLLAGTEMLLQAQQDINAGNSLLGSDTSLSDIAAEVQSLNVSGETLSQTYARLMSEQEELTTALSETGLSTGKTGAAFVTFADQMTSAAGSLQNLTTLWNNYYTGYYSASEQSVNQLAALAKSSNADLAAIGESSTTTMAQFKADFAAALPNLSASQVVQWLNAATALEQYSSALATNASVASTVSGILSQLGITTGKTGQAFTDFANELASDAGGISNLSSAWNTYYTEFYSASEQAANTLAQLTQAVKTQFAAIGQDPTESMAQFRANFAAALPTLTPDQILAWLAASQALDALTQATTANAAAAAQSATIAQGLQATLDQLGLSTGKTGAAFQAFSDELVTDAGSLSALQTAWQTYYSEFYSASQQAGITLQQLKDAVDTQFAAIGQSPTESMAEFAKNFAAALPTLTPEEVLQWLAAGDALSKLTAQINSNAAAALAATQKYDSFIDSFASVINPLDDFQNSLVGLANTLESNIEQANSLAQAAGMAGASSKDLATILQASAIQGAAALRTEASNIASLVSTLFGTSLDQLNAKLAAEQASLAGVDQSQISAYGMDQYYQAQIDATQAQIAAANKAAQAAQDLSNGTQLLQDLGDYGSVTGQSLNSLATQFGIPLDQLATKMGTTIDGLQKQFAQDEQTALAALSTATNTQLTAEYLADIKAILAGQTEPYSGAELAVAGATRDAPGSQRHIPPINTNPNPSPGNPIDRVQRGEMIAMLSKLNDRLDTNNRHLAALRNSGEITATNTAKTAVNTGMQRPNNNNTRPQRTVHA